MKPYFWAVLYFLVIRIEIYKPWFLSRTVGFSGTALVKDER
jgi:hypothetical protein